MTMILPFVLQAGTIKCSKFKPITTRLFSFFENVLKLFYSNSKFKTISGVIPSDPRFRGGEGMGKFVSVHRKCTKSLPQQCRILFLSTHSRRIICSTNTNNCDSIRDWTECETSGSHFQWWGREHCFCFPEMY